MSKTRNIEISLALPIESKGFDPSKCPFFDTKTKAKMTPGPFKRPVGSPNGPVTRLGASLVAFLIPKVAPRAPQRHPKGSPRPTKVARWRQNGRLQWPFRPPKPPQELPKAPQGTHCLPKSQIFTPESSIFSQINDFQQSIVHRRPTDVQRTSPNMGRRQCYAHQYTPPHSYNTVCPQKFMLGPSHVRGVTF